MSPYDERRPEMVDLIPATVQTLLDVGCDTGKFAQDLVEAGREIEISGIDPIDLKGEPETGYSRRFTGYYPADLPADLRFDCLVFNDVLEHMPDPWESLRQSHDHVTPDGVIVASIPNVRSIRVLQPLLLRGEWEYADSGILDRTHLRFFTKSAIIDLFESTGWIVESIQPIRLIEEGKWATVNRITKSRLEDFLAERYAILARPNPTR